MGESSNPRPLRWKRVLLAGLAATAAVGTTFVWNQSHIATLRTDAETAQKRNVIDQMLSDGVTASDREKLYRHLTRAPLPVLQAVQQNGTRIAVLHQGQTLADLHLIRPLDVRETYRDAEAMGNDAAVTLDSADTQTDDALRIRAPWLQINDRYELRIEPYVPDDDEEPTTLSTIAEQHGATTAAQKSEFVTIMKRLNGPRLFTSATADAVPDNSTVAIENRRFVPNLKLLVPSVYYGEAVSPRTDSRGGRCKPGSSIVQKPPTT